MTSVDAFGSSKLEPWMVSKLFGSASQDQGGGQTSSPTSNRSPEVSSSSVGQISSTLAQALSRLKVGGASEAAGSGDAGQASGDWQARMDALSYVTWIRNNAMTSHDVEAAMYGSGIAASHGGTISFADVIAKERGSIQSSREFYSQNFDLSEADRQAELKKDDDNSKFLDQLQAAYSNHTLKFQNAGDVAGLDFSGFVSASGAATPQTESYNSDFYQNRSNKDTTRMIDTGTGLTLYVSW